MKPEFRTNPSDAGMCAHGNFKDSCAACKEENDKQNDGKLSLKEAQEETHKIREKAIEQKAKENITGGFMDDNEFKEYIGDEYGKEKFDEEKERIRIGINDQPSRNDYNHAHEEVKNNKSH